jgi:hypothetical protein
MQLKFREDSIMDIYCIVIDSIKICYVEIFIYTALHCFPSRSIAFQKKHRASPILHKENTFFYPKNGYR